MVTVRSRHGWLPAADILSTRFTGLEGEMQVIDDYQAISRGVQRLTWQALGTSPVPLTIPIIATDAVGLGSCSGSS